MSYCNNQWISDYTYTGMYNYMLGHPSAPVQADARAAALSGDFLILAGEIDPAAPSGGFSFVRRVDSVTGLPRCGLAITACACWMPAMASWSPSRSSPNRPG